ncbi:type II secretion system protein [Persephonella sp. IF05-L8]|uniref:prepilin-type N-terminal cleavage/methylation domain-containing protein n=1 Tax=Persephonella sp. IF05-L8 TaxID=1158338 RepID=UPI0004966ED2
MNNKKGLTVTELLVTMFIVGIILAAAYFTYIKLLKGFKSESSKVATQIENLVGLEIIRLDLEHIGYGIPVDETNKIIDWVNKELIFRSTLNNTNSITRGYLLAKCNSGSLDITYDGRENPTAVYVSVIDTNTKLFFAAGTINNGIIENLMALNGNTVTCLNNRVYIAYPVRDSVYDGTRNGCVNSLCEEITYSLSQTNLIDRCNPDTYNLIRKVGPSATSGEPVLNCVADWKVTFDIDTDGNGIIDTGEQNQSSPPLNNTDIRNKLKAINVYILVQEGRYDADFTYSQAVDCGSKKCVQINGQDLELPTNYEHYRWKPLMIKVKPMDL